MVLISLLFKSKFTCLEVASRVEAGASQCDWNEVDLSCSMRPPPTDPIFTILVSLLTVLISIPVTMILTIVLEEYCSKCAGGRSHEEDFILEKNESIATSVSEDTPMLKNANEYAFGDVIRKGIWKGSPSNVNGTSDTSKTAYNGMSTFNLKNQKFLINFENN